MILTGTVPFALSLALQHLLIGTLLVAGVATALRLAPGCSSTTRYWIWVLTLLDMGADVVRDRGAAALEPGAAPGAAPGR